MHFGDADVRRNAYLHESGHSIVALELGLLVSEIHCDGQTGHCKADQTLTDQVNVEAAVHRHLSNATIVTFQQVVNAYFGRLATMLGGIAGESLDLGRPIFSTRRAADDFTMFFGFMAAMSRGISSEQAHPIWLATYAKAQDEAWRIVLERESDVRKVATELERVATISGDDLLKLV